MLLLMAMERQKRRFALAVLFAVVAVWAFLAPVHVPQVRAAAKPEAQAPVAAPEPVQPAASSPDEPGSASEAVVVARRGPSQEAVQTVVPSFTLKDQHNDPHEFAFPAHSFFVVGIADYEGSKYASGWYEPFHARYGDRAPVIALGATDSVPRIWRPWLRWYLRRHVDMPILLDWQGEVVKAFGFKPHQINVLVVTPEGAVAARWEGAATPEKLGQLYAAVDPLVGPRMP